MFYLVLYIIKNTHFHINSNEMVGSLPNMDKIASGFRHTTWQRLLRVSVLQEWSWKRKGEITNGGMCLTSDPIETHGYVMVHFCTNEHTQVGAST